MLCEDVRRRLMEYIDRELEAAEAESLEEHVAWCGDCAEELSALRWEVASVDAAMRAAFAAVRPNPGRRRSFMRRLSPIRLRPALELAAAALIFAISLWFAAADSTLDRYRDSLAMQSRQELDRLSSLTSTGILDDLIPLEAAVLEDALLEASEPGSVQEVAWDPRPRDAKRRSAARRHLAALSRNELQRALPQIEDASLARYARALLRTMEEPAPPRPEGSPHWSVSMSTQAGRVLFEQWRNGAVRVTAGRRQVVASDVFELMEQEPELCRRFGITGDGRTVKVGLALKSTVTLRRSLGRAREHVLHRDWNRAAEEMAAARMDALMTELVRSQGENAAHVVQRIRSTLAQISSDPRLAELRRRLKPHEAEQARSLEELHERVMRLSAFCEQLP